MQPQDVSDIKLYYGYDPYYDDRTLMTNANGKIRNLVWEELPYNNQPSN